MNEGDVEGQSLGLFSEYLGLGTRWLDHEFDKSVLCSRILADLFSWFCFVVLFVLETYPMVDAVNRVHCS
jgi:hypothetical protein